MTLKKQIEQHELRIVSLDVPTLWQALSDKDPSQADRERHQKVLYYRRVKKLSIWETADATGYSPSQVCRIQSLYLKEVKF